MELQTYYIKQIKREFSEKYNILSLNDLEVIHKIRVIYKTSKLMRTPYTSNFILRRKFLLESFTGSFWNTTPVHYPKPGRPHERTSDFFILFTTLLKGQKIFNFLISIYIFIVWRNRLARTRFICSFSDKSNKLVLKLNRINLAPWLPPAARQLVNIKSIYIHFYISHNLLFRSLVSRLQLQKYIVFK